MMIFDRLDKEQIGELFDKVKLNWPGGVPDAEIKVTDERVILNFDIAEKPRSSCGISVEQINTCLKELEYDEAIEWCKDAVYNAYNVIQSMESEVGKITKEYVLENVIIHICNKYDEKFMQKDVINEIVKREYLDFYLYCSFEFCYGQFEIKVSRNLLEEIGLSEDELFKTAMKNLNCKYSFELNAITGLMRPKEIRDFSELAMYKNEKIFLLQVTNDVFGNGATSILMDGLLDNIANGLNDDLILMPSSKDNWIIGPVGEQERESIISHYGSMVIMTNMESLKSHSRLSNNVFIYEKEKKQIINITNLENGVSDVATKKAYRELCKKFA